MNKDLEIAALQLTLEKFQQLDAEAATHVETRICMKSLYFTGEHPYVGWKGLGLALGQDYELMGKLLEFTRWAIRECCFEELGELPWDAVNSKALELGLIVSHTATAENKDQWEEIEDVEEGEYFYTFCEELGPRRHKIGAKSQEAGTR